MPESLLSEAHVDSSGLWQVLSFRDTQRSAGSMANCSLRALAGSRTSKSFCCSDVTVACRPAKPLPTSCVLYNHVLLPPNSKVWGSLLEKATPRAGWVACGSELGACGSELGVPRNPIGGSEHADRSWGPRNRRWHADRSWGSQTAWVARGSERRARGWMGVDGRRSELKVPRTGWRRRATWIGAGARRPDE